MRLKPYYDPEDRPTHPPEQLADNEDELDPEELDQPRRQTQGKTDNTEDNRVRKQKVMEQKAIKMVIEDQSLKGRRNQRVQNKSQRFQKIQVQNVQQILNL